MDIKYFEWLERKNDLGWEYYYNKSKESDWSITYYWKLSLMYENKFQVITNEFTPNDVVYFAPKSLGISLEDFEFKNGFAVRKIPVNNKSMLNTVMDLFKK